MKYPNNALLFISLFLLLAQQLAQSAATEAASVLAAFAEHEIVTSDLHLSYEDAAGLADSFLYHYSIGAEPELFPDAYASWDVSFAPYSSTIATDAIDAQLSLGLEYGQPVTGATYTNDTFVVDLSGQIAAQAALNRRGNPADGRVNGTVKGEFDLEPGYGGAVHGDVVGMLVVPQYNLDTGLTYLDFSFGQTHTDGAEVMYTEVLYPSPFPFGEMQFELLAGEAYMFKIEYEAYVPYGAVGSHSADFLIPIIPQGDFYGVPEPAALLLALLGLSLLPRRRGR